MSLPRIAIVGRPNVGKSTLANRLARKRVSIVDALAGVTRDRVALTAWIPVPEGVAGGGERGERVVEVIDTGGIGIVDRGDLGPKVAAQIRAALDTCHVVLFVVDVRDGLTPQDAEVARWLRGRPQPVLVVANKAEDRMAPIEAEAFRRLGFPGDPLPISAQNGEGIRDLEERIAAALPPLGEGEHPPAPSLKLAVVGRRNAGKSTLINAWAREERVIVSEVPGTTRDAVDVILERAGETWVVIDTAGLRRAKSFEHGVDFFSDVRSHEAVRRADVVLLLFDATEPISQIEKKLARYCADHFKPLILGANKWDLAREAAQEDFERYLAAELPGMTGAPISFLSGLTGQNVWETLDLARELHDAANKRVGTAELNRVLARALEARSPSRQGHHVRINYATQAETRPPTFVLFVNDARWIGKDYVRYLENRLRDAFGFGEVPVRVQIRDKNEARVGDAP